MTPLDAAERAVLDALDCARDQLNDDAYRALITRLEAAVAKERELLSLGARRDRRRA